MQALALQPNRPDVLANLGFVLQRQGRLEEAAAHFQRVVELCTAVPDAHNNLGIVLQQLGRLDDAESCFRRALELNPGFAAAANNLGVVIRSKGDLDAARVQISRGIEMLPDAAPALSNLGFVLNDLDRLDEAAKACLKSIEQNPRLVAPQLNLGNVRRNQGNIDAALVCFKTALELDPGSAAAYMNIGVAHKEAGRLAAFRRSSEICPDPHADSNFVYTQTFCPEYDSTFLREEPRRWNERHAAHLARLPADICQDRNPARRLRIGYVSANFRDHAVGRNVLPLIEHHDRDLIFTALYSNAQRHDAITDRFRQRADLWQEVADCSDARLQYQRSVFTRTRRNSREVRYF